MMTKMVAAILTVFVAPAAMLFAQGRVNFDNLASGNTIAIASDVGVFPFPSQGLAGQFVGAEYSIQLLWVPGVFASEGSFFAAQPSRSAEVPFFGITSGSPVTDGAGLFDGGILQVGTPGTYTMMAQAWYNGGQYPTWEASYSGFGYVGRSSLFTINATAEPTPAPHTIFPSFTVSGFVPEPATHALVGLGIGALLLYRNRSARQKKVE